MTEEEINKKAEKHCNEVLCNAHEKCNEVIKCRDWRSRRAGFFCGYEQALKDFEKENAELKEQIGKMKCCYNCSKWNEGLLLCNDSTVRVATYEDFMREDFKAISGCTHMAMLEGWETSAGARREKAEAERLGLEVMYYRAIGGKK